MSHLLNNKIVTHDVLEILAKAVITTKVAIIYATLEAKAAPDIPHFGIRHKFKGMFTAKEKKAA